MNLNIFSPCINLCQQGRNYFSRLNKKNSQTLSNYDNQIMENFHEFYPINQIFLLDNILAYIKKTIFCGLDQKNSLFSNDFCCFFDPFDTNLKENSLFHEVLLIKIEVF